MVTKEEKRMLNLVIDLKKINRILYPNLNTFKSFNGDRKIIIKKNKDVDYFQVNSINGFSHCLIIPFKSKKAIGLKVKIVVENENQNQIDEWDFVGDEIIVSKKEYKKMKLKTIERSI